MIEKPQFDVLTISKRFNDISVSRIIFSWTIMHQFSAAGTDGFIMFLSLSRLLCSCVFAADLSSGETRPPLLDCWVGEYGQG